MACDQNSACYIPTFGPYGGTYGAPGWSQYGSSSYWYEYYHSLEYGGIDFVDWYSCSSSADYCKYGPGSYGVEPLNLVSVYVEGLNPPKWVSYYYPATSGCDPHPPSNCTGPVFDYVGRFEYGSSAYYYDWYYTSTFGSSDLIDFFYCPDHQCTSNDRIEQTLLYTNGYGWVGPWQNIQVF
jgi:hypothetical protein